MTDTDQQIVFCDKNDQTIGVGNKIESHTSDTKLHKAFSCYIFDSNDRFLLTRRAETKRVWPGVWTNSLCGHPTPDESREQAITRRAHEELGIELSNITLIIPEFIYKTPPYNGIIEHEYCPIYLAQYSGKSDIPFNSDEVAEISWLSYSEFLQLPNREDLSYWSQLQLPLVIKALA